jgi:hypothetical protein
VVGSKERFLEYARLSHDREIATLVERWDGLSSSDRRALSIPDLCTATGVPFSKLLGEVTAQAFEHNSDVSRLIAAVNQPRVVGAAVRSAIRVGTAGVRDRQMLLAHSGFLPVPKSASTIFHLQQQINNTREADGEETTALPSFSADIIAINAAQRGKLFPTAVDAESQGEQAMEGMGMRENSTNSAG